MFHTQKTACTADSLVNTRTKETKIPRHAQNLTKKKNACTKTVRTVYRRSHTGDCFFRRWAIFQPHAVTDANNNFRVMKCEVLLNGRSHHPHKTK